MTLDDFKTDNSGTKQYKRYNETEKDKTLEQILNNNRHKFPIELDIDFIEASPEMKSMAVRTYFKTNDGKKITYIRVRSDIVEEENEILEKTVLEAMASVFLDQVLDDTVEMNSALHHWVCGQVGAYVGIEDGRYYDFMKVMDHFDEIDYDA